jgi:hypothetical protein
MVRKRGFEPLRPFGRQPLKLVRLPFRHFRVALRVGEVRPEPDAATCCLPAVQEPALLPASMVPARPGPVWVPQPAEARAFR